MLSDALHVVRSWWGLITGLALTVLVRDEAYFAPALALVLLLWALSVPATEALWKTRQSRFPNPETRAALRKLLLRPRSVFTNVGLVVHVNYRTSDGRQRQRALFPSIKAYEAEGNAVHVRIVKAGDGRQPFSDWSAASSRLTAALHVRVEVHEMTHASRLTQRVTRQVELTLLPNEPFGDRH